MHSLEISRVLLLHAVKMRKTLANRYLLSVRKKYLMLKWL
jgi:hypothetical protein